MCVCVCFPSSLLFFKHFQHFSKSKSTLTSDACTDWFRRFVTAKYFVNIQNINEMRTHWAALHERLMATENISSQFTLTCTRVPLSVSNNSIFFSSVNLRSLERSLEWFLLNRPKRDYGTEKWRMCVCECGVWMVNLPMATSFQRFHCWCCCIASKSKSNWEHNCRASLVSSAHTHTQTVFFYGCFSFHFFS